VENWKYFKKIWEEIKKEKEKAVEAY
jgi:hypothetical protein